MSWYSALLARCLGIDVEGMTVALRFSVLEDNRRVSLAECEQGSLVGVVAIYSHYKVGWALMERANICDAQDLDRVTWVGPYGIRCVVHSQSPRESVRVGACFARSLAAVGLGCMSLARAKRRMEDEYESYIRWVIEGQTPSGGRFAAHVYRRAANDKGMLRSAIRAMSSVCSVHDMRMRLVDCAGNTLRSMPLVDGVPCGCNKCYGGDR